MKFAKEFLIGVLWEDHDDDTVKVVSDEISYTSRWSVHHEMIFQVGDKLYSTTYSVGATESQDEQAFEYADDEIECDEVEPYEVTTIKYRKKTV